MSPAAEAPVAPALGYSILANLGDEKQITVQCFADSEEDLPSIHAKIDKAMAVIDRQKSFYRKRDLVKEVEKMDRTRRQLHEDLARLESDFEKNQEAINSAIAANVQRTASLLDAANAKGRAKPVGADAAAVNAIRRENEQLSEQKAKAAADRQQARDNIAVSIGRYNEEIAKAEEQIAECDAIIGGG